jgi:hypothetical protein
MLTLWCTEVTYSSGFWLYHKYDGYLLCNPFTWNKVTVPNGKSEIKSVQFPYDSDISRIYPLWTDKEEVLMHAF